jgi:zinc transport system substrate-binding protein
VSPRVAQIVADEVGAQTRVLSPIESRPPSGDYLTLSRENLTNLREAMRCT